MSKPSSKTRIIRTSNFEVEFDESKALEDNIKDALKNIVAKDGVTKAKKLAFLNTLVKTWETKKDDLKFKIKIKEILLCLRVPLIHESYEVRAAALRTIRCFIDCENDAQLVNNLNIHFIIAKSLDIDLDNKLERVHALRLARKLLFLSPKTFPDAITRALVSIAKGDNNIEDRLKTICLAILCELSVFNSTAFISCKGISALINSILGCSMPRICEALIGTLLRLYCCPQTRRHSNIHLDVVMAPFTEFRYVHNDFQNNPTTNAVAASDLANADRSLRFQSGKQAILSLLRSWPGLLHLTNKKKRSRGLFSPLQSLVNTLYLSNTSIRDKVITILYEALGFRIPINTTNFKDALESVDASFFKESWKLSEGFVASEGMNLLPSIIKSRPNLQESHLSLLLCFLLKTDLSSALIEVIVTSNVELSIQATILLGEFLYSSSVLLPRELNIITHCLPQLLKISSSSDPYKSVRASEAVTYLQQIHEKKKQRGPNYHSLFLDQILSNSEGFSSKDGMNIERYNTPKWSQYFSKSITESAASIIHDTAVLSTDIYNEWNWALIYSILRRPEGENAITLEINPNKEMIKRLIEFYKTSNNEFSTLELNDKKTRIYSKIGCFLIEYLLKEKSIETESLRLLNELITDIDSQFGSLISCNSAHECFFSPTRINTTACQFYFLFIGQLSRSEDGRKILDSRKILQRLFELINLKNDVYLKLVVTCLDYSSSDWGSRNILSKVCRESPESCRLFATKFLGVLIRSRTPNISIWAIELLVNQLNDNSKIIPWIALDILDEVCDDKMNLEALVCVLTPKKNLDHLGFRGVLLFTQFIASSKGFKVLRDSNLLNEQITLWNEMYNVRYVYTVEEILNDSFTLHQHDEERAYGRRTNEAYTTKPVYLPPHLYGKLASSSEGFEVLKDIKNLHDMIDLIQNLDATIEMSDKVLITVKASIWAVCHVACSSESISICPSDVIRNVTRIAENSPNYSLRATAFYALNLIAMSHHGAEILKTCGWLTIKSSRDDEWPVNEDLIEAYQPNYFNETLDTNSITESDSESIETKTLDPNQIDVASNHSDLNASTTSTMSRRKRLSRIFRSFSLGTSSDHKKKLQRIKKNIFLTTSFTHEETTPLESDSKLLKDKANTSSTLNTVDNDEIASINTPTKTKDTTLTNINEETTKIPDSLHNDEESIRNTSQISVPKCSDQPKLSPIPSAASIASTKSPTIEPQVVVTTSNPVKKEDILAYNSNKLKIKRSGQRCFSESEVFDHVTPSNVPDNRPSQFQSTPINALFNQNRYFSSLASSNGSWTDNPGYYTIRAIHNKRRPLLALNKSGGESKDKSTNPDFKRSFHRRDPNKSRTLDHRLTRTNRAYSTLPHPNNSSSVVSTPLTTKLFEDEEGPEYLYRGITLPADIDVLYPNDESDQDENETNDNESEKNGSIQGADYINEWLNKTQPKCGNFSNFHGLDLHSPCHCLSCFRLSMITKSDKFDSTSDHEDIHSENTDSSNILELNDRLVTSGQCSPLALRQLRKTSLVDSEDSYNYGGSTQSLKSDSEGKSTSENIMGKILQRKEVIRLVGSMIVSIGVKTAEQGLLKLKQKYPGIFQDLCLYSEICLMLSKYSFRLSSRRFIQELFLNLQYEELYVEPYKLLGLDETPNLLSQLDEITSEDNS